MKRDRFDAASMSLSEAQRDMRFAYYNGAMGMLTSAIVWLVAGIMAALGHPERAVWALFIGGVFIHPISVVMYKLLGRPGNHTPGNPLGALAMEGTVSMILMMPLAYAVSMLHIEWFFPAMLFVIGGRYLSFATMYGNRIYWAVGAALGLAGYVLATMKAAPQYGAFAGAAIEALFASVLLVIPRQDPIAPPGSRKLVDTMTGKRP